MAEIYNPDDVINALTEFMAMRGFVHKNQQTTVRGYLAAIKYFHKVYVGWDLPTTHGMIQAVGKGIDRAHASIHVKPHTRRPLTWPLLKQGRQLIIEEPEYGHVMWLGLALSYFLLCRVSELWAYPDGKAHPEFCLTRDCIQFFRGEIPLDFANRTFANQVKIHCLQIRPKKDKLHHYENEDRRLGPFGWSAGGRVRGAVGPARRAPATARPRTPDVEVHVVRMEGLH